MRTVLVIAGYDPSGGAGVLADVKTLAAMGCYGVAALTSITHQNTLGVLGAEHVGRATLEAQVRPLLEDFALGAVKTGMLPTAELVEAAAALLDGRVEAPLVVDPVVRSSSGFDLVDEAAVDAIRARLLPRARVVTPNAPEAERLTGLRVRTEAEMESAARALVDLGAAAALVKGGHVEGDGRAVDVLVDGDRLWRFEGERVESSSTHGTGCALASAVAAGLALGRSLPDAVRNAKEFVAGAIRGAPGLGRGHGPLDHFWRRRSGA